MFIYLQSMGSPKEKSNFEQIYYEYRGILFHVAMSYLHNEFDAEDAVQQAFLYAAENMQKFSSGICPKTLRYLVITVRCRAADILRQKNRCLTVEDAEKTAVPERDGSGLSPLAACIAKLPERYRDALILRTHYGFEFREIAKLMNITEANARKTVTRARKMLEKICIEEGVL